MRISGVSTLFGLWCLGACASSPVDPGPVGLHSASADPAPGTLRPVDSGDPESIAQRGRLLAQLEAALALAPAEMRQAALKGHLWPVADIDPGGKSGQVMFYRPIPEPEKRGPVATRWRRVSMSLDPPRILEVAPLQGAPTPRSGEDLRVRALAAAMSIAATKGRGPSHAHVIFEGTTAGAVQLRAYVFGDSVDQPDLDIVFELAKRHPWVQPVAVAEIHPAGGRTPEWIVTPEPAPSAITVARALARSHESAGVRVRTASGDVLLSTSTGRPAQPHPAR